MKKKISATGGKSKTLKLFLISSLAILGLTFFISGANAQENQQPIENTIVIATVNIYNTQIISQNNNNFKISFDLFNRENIQPDVKYSVQLIKRENGGAFKIDERVYGETLTIGPGETVKKEIDYFAPEYLKGTFEIWVQSQTSDSLPLGQGLAGEVTLNGSGQYVELITSSCYLTVEGEVPEKKYGLMVGADIDPNEKLRGICEVSNNFSSPIEFTPRFKTFYRSIFGELVPDNKEPQPTSRIGAQEKKSFYFILPKAMDPQAYDAVLELVDAQGKVISNQVIFHYVLRGQSATIQNIRLDKDYYSRGDTAKAVISWSGSADSHMNTRRERSDIGEVNLEIIIKDGKGKLCAQPISQPGPSSEFARLQPIELSISIIEDCLNPSVSARVENEKGVLVEKAISLVTKNPSISKENDEEKISADNNMLSKNNSKQWLFIIISFLFIISLGLIFVYRKKLFGLNIFFFIIGAALLSVKVADADTFSNRYCDSPTHCFYTNVSVSLDESEYSYPEQKIITASATLTDAYCNNGVPFNGYVYGKNSANNEEKTILSNASWSTSGASYYAVPLTDGEYNMKFTAHSSYEGKGGISSIHKIPYTVIVAPTVDLVVNDDPSDNISIKQGDELNFTWETANATSCEAGGYNWPREAINPQRGSKSITAGITGEYVLKCEGSGESASDEVSVNVFCTASCPDWEAIECSKPCGEGTRTRNCIAANCNQYQESQVCNAQACFDWKEVDP